MLGRFRGAPIRVHWTAPLVAVVFGRFAFVPAFWAAFLGVILIHELGHALVVRWCGARVTSIDLDGAGGLCHWRGEVTPKQSALISWGGVLAQLVAFLVTVLALALFGAPSNPHVAQVADVLTRVNLAIAAFNLIPVGFLDGATAWKLVPLLVDDLRARFASLSKRRALRRAAAAELADFERTAARSDPATSAEVHATLARIASEVNDTAAGGPRDG